MRAATILLLAFAATASQPAFAATWSELSAGAPAVRPVAWDPRSATPTNGCPPCGPAASGPVYGAPPAVASPYGATPFGGAMSGAPGGPGWPGTNGWGGPPSLPYDAPGVAALPPGWSTPPEALLPMRDGNLPNGAVQLWSFGQINNSTDPYNPWGLSTPFMFVPWSTPLSGWTNAQTWNWWRTRSGVRSPAW
ncbi:MAG: hypothetical protein LWW93_11790 [Hyphomicrobiales bacterium]|nr:hypothetical protein [Hyphomicrobiales bacterium]